MYWAIDLLASEYGWSKKSILEDVYIDELVKLSEKIKKRKNSEYKMQLVIVSNPYSKDPKKLMDMLDDKPNSELRDEKLDRESFIRLREQLSRSQSIKVK